MTGSSYSQLSTRLPSGATQTPNRAIKGSSKETGHRQRRRDGNAQQSNTPLARGNRPSRADVGNRPNCGNSTSGNTKAPTSEPR